MCVKESNKNRKNIKLLQVFSRNWKKFLFSLSKGERKREKEKVKIQNETSIAIFHFITLENDSYQKGQRNGVKRNLIEEP